MTKIIPFKAVVYNQDKIKDPAGVVCPPYDIISSQKQKALHERSPYNLIHLELGLDQPSSDKYAAAGNLFREWLKKEILVADKKPSLYLYSQQYSIKGETKTRLGFLALLKLEDGKSPVFKHEHTHLEPKEDRLKLIRQVKANLSPIFVVIADKKRVIQQSLKPFTLNSKPFIDVTDDEKTSHKLWRVDDPGLLEKIQAKLTDENLFIADGHHRYEVSCAYRDEMRKKNPGFTGEEGFNYLLAYFTNMDSLGLTVLPIHRLVKLPAKPDMPRLILKLNEYFHAEEIKDKTKFFFMLEKAGQAEHAIGIYNGANYWLLRLKNIRVLDKMIADKPAEYRCLDVAILNALILENAMKLDLDDKSVISFSANTDELINQVNNDNSCVAFLLNPTKIEQIVSVALNGERMPPKSTYFYPKVLSGLVVNQHEG